MQFEILMSGVMRKHQESTVERERTMNSFHLLFNHLFIEKTGWIRTQLSGQGLLMALLFVLIMNRLKNLLSATRTGAAGFVFLFASFLCFSSFSCTPAESETAEKEPEKKKIVFMSQMDPFTRSRSVYIINCDGCGKKRLTENHSVFPVLSPDGEKIVYSTGGVRHVETSRDGRKVRLSSSSLYLMKSDGSGKKRLFEKIRTFPNMVCWSPDSRKIAAGQSVVDLDGKVKQYLVIQAFHSPAWSPDGKRIAFKSPYEHKTGIVGGCGLFVLNLDDGDYKLITGDIDERGKISWSPDSRKIAYVFHSNVHIIDLQASKGEQLTDDGHQNNAPSWHPSGKEIVYESSRAIPGGNKHERDIEIYSINVATKKIRQITDTSRNNEFPRLSSDGGLIVFKSSSNPKLYSAEIGIVNFDGTGFKLLTDNDVFDGGPEL